MSRGRRVALLGSLAIIAFAACDLNPQPLPPLDPENNQATGGDGFGSDAGLSFEPNDRGSDAAAVPSDNTDAASPEVSDGGSGGQNDAGVDAGDAAPADAGDAG